MRVSDFLIPSAYRDHTIFTTTPSQFLYSYALRNCSSDTRGQTRANAMSMKFCSPFSCGSLYLYVPTYVIPGITQHDDTEYHFKTWDEWKALIFCEFECVITTSCEFIISSDISNYLLSSHQQRNGFWCHSNDLSVWAFHWNGAHMCDDWWWWVIIIRMREE